MIITVINYTVKPESGEGKWKIKNLKLRDIYEDSCF